MEGEYPLMGGESPHPPILASPDMMVTSYDAKDDKDKAIQKCDDAEVLA